MLKQNLESLLDIIISKCKKINITEYNIESLLPKEYYDFFVENSYLTQEQFLEIVGEFLKIERIKLKNFKVPKGFDVFDIEFMEESRFIPYEIDKDMVKIVFANPLDMDLRDVISNRLQRLVVPFIATEKEIIKCLRQNIPDRDRAVDIISKELRLYGRENIDKEFRVQDSDDPVVRFVNSMIINAIEERASDIHIETYSNQLKIKFRVDGALQDIVSNIDPSLQSRVISRIKILANLDIAETRIPQDGRFRLKIMRREIDFRVSILPSIFGETAVIRILDKQAQSLELTELGFLDEQLDLFKKYISLPYGMILVSGPTGSGKTTTLYSALKYIKKSEDKVITIEDPVEYQLFDIIQIPVNEKKGLTFDKGLRSIVRHDPDKIMVGEIRDYETAEISVNAALTGHLVFSTIHANNVIDSIFRLINLGVDLYQFVTAFNMIVGQRLVRKICPFCKEKAGKFMNFTIYKGRGCVHCNKTGYLERTAIFEVFPMTSEIKELIYKKATPIELKKIAKKENIIDLKTAGIQKLKEGITTVEELNRVTFFKV